MFPSTSSRETSGLLGKHYYYYYYDDNDDDDDDDDDDYYYDYSSTCISTLLVFEFLISFLNVCIFTDYVK